VMVASAMLKSTVSGKLDAQLKAIAAERKRLQVLDDAEKKARKEQQEERLRLEKDRQRIEQEQKAMIEWEVYQPPPPPEVTITGITEEEPFQAVLSDGRTLPIPAEKVEALKEMLASLVGMDPPKVVVASQFVDEKVELSASAGEYVDDFRLADVPAAPPADGEEAAGDVAVVAAEGGD